VFDTAHPDEISLEFLEWADQRILNLRSYGGKGRPMAGEHMIKLAEGGHWDKFVLDRSKYRRLYIVECEDPRPGKLEVVRVSPDYEYGELFGFRKTR
jgi:hypothetical protein